MNDKCMRYWRKLTDTQATQDERIRKLEMVESIFKSKLDGAIDRIMDLEDVAHTPSEAECEAAKPAPSPQPETTGETLYVRVPRKKYVIPELDAMGRDYFHYEATPAQVKAEAMRLCPELQMAEKVLAVVLDGDKPKDAAIIWRLIDAALTKIGESGWAEWVSELAAALDAPDETAKVKGCYGKEHEF